MGLMLAAGFAAPGLAHAQPVDLFFERAVMMAADDRCDLFAPALSQALAVGAAQARGSALRAGVAPEALRTVERNARVRAARTACRSPDLAASADRVRNAFDGYARLHRLTYPGDFASWRADRIAARKVRWRLVQETRFGRDQLAFGLAGVSETGHLMAVARFADGAEPYGARLVTRDLGRTSGPYLDRYYGGPTAALPLHRRVPPASAQKGFLAQARSPAGQDLLPDDAREGWAFRFPPQAVRQLVQLDPREAVMVEFLFSGGVRRAYVEVGDFAAGRAFLSTPPVSGRTRPAQVALGSPPPPAR
jgi:hypothetical protein